MMSLGDEPGSLGDLDGGDVEKEIVSSGFIFDQSPYRSCHAATIVEVSPGILVSAWFGGTAERNPDVCIYVARFENGKWNQPIQVANGIQEDGTRLPTWNPVLFQTPEGRLQLYYKVGPSPSQWWGMLMESSDGGTHWNIPSRLPVQRIGPVKNKPIVLTDGTWLAPSSRESDGWTVHIERSTDQGKSWSIIGPLNDGRKVLSIQPTLLDHGDGTVHLLARGRNDRITESWSKDYGLTWTPLLNSSLPNNNSGFDAVQLKNGSTLLVYNHSTREQPGMGHKGRGILNVAVSRDGINWEAALILDYIDEPEKQFSYPSVIQSTDGLVHVVYTWHREKIKHVTLDPNRLNTVPIRGDQWPSQVQSGHRVKLP